MSEEEMSGREKFQRIKRIELLVDAEMEALVNDLKKMMKEHGILMVTTPEASYRVQLLAILELAYVTGVFDPTPVIEKHWERLRGLMNDHMALLSGRTIIGV